MRIYSANNVFIEVTRRCNMCCAHCLRGVDKLEYEFNKTGDIDFYSGELYLNAIGDVVSGCDWSYKSQKKYRFGNVMNKNWLENISNSELYIAS